MTALIILVLITGILLGLMFAFVAMLYIGEITIIVDKTDITDLTNKNERIKK